jgi:signal transduction histidine kinase
LEIKLAVEPVALNGSAMMVACVVNNLLLNAVNFTRGGAIDIRPAGNELVVQDTGIGIPPEPTSAGVGV